MEEGQETHNGRPPSPRRPEQAFPYYYQDEISLTDIFVVLLRHKRLLLVVFVLFSLAGLAVALVLPDKYRYYTALEIGSRLVEVEGKIEAVPLDEPSNVAARLEQSAVPSALDRYYRDNPESQGSFKIQIESPKESRVVVAQATATLDQSTAILRVLREAVEAIKIDHDMIIQSLRKGYEQKLAEHQQQLREIDALTGTGGEPTTGGSAGDREAPGSKAGTSGRRGHDTQAAASAIGERKKVEQEVARAESLLLGLQETRLVSAPTRELMPQGPNRLLILAVALLSGVLTGVCAAFFVELVGRAQAQLRRSESS